MTITLQAPYSNDWDYGYLVFNKGEGRMMLQLFNKKQKRHSTTAYARYLMAVKLGRYLTKEEQVDHIDNDKTNDNIDNLQILSKEANLRKYQNTIPHNIHGTSSMYSKGCRCAMCCAYMRRCRENSIKRSGSPRARLYEHTCKTCGKHFLGKRSSQFCSKKCANKETAKAKQKFTATNEELLAAKEELGSWAAVGRRYSVSTAAIKYRLGLYTRKAAKSTGVINND